MAAAANSHPANDGDGPTIVVYSRMWLSGTGLYVQGLARGLAVAGHRVIFIAPAGAPDDPAGALPNVTRITPPRDVIAPETAPRAVRAWRSLHRIVMGLGALLAARAKSPRIIVSIPEPLIFWLPTLALLRLTGAQVAFVCHDPVPHAWRLPRWLRSIEHGAHAASYRLAWRIVVLGQATRRTLIDRFGIDPDKISVIAHGAFDVPWAGLAPGCGRLLSFGTIRRNKQVLVAMDAVARVAASGRSVRLVVAGGADANDPGYAAECEQRAADLGDAVSVDVGYVDDAKVTALLRDCDALLLPYADFQSQSGVAVLAGMAGRPVIAAPAGGIPDLIADGLSAILIDDPVGIDDVAAAVTQFLDAPTPEWRDRSEEGRTRLLSTLAWPTIAARFAAMFDAPRRP